MDFAGKGGLPGEGGRGLPGEGGRGVPGVGWRPKELDRLGGRLGNLGGGWVGVAPTAACAWTVKSVSPGGKLRVAVMRKPGNWRDVVTRRSECHSREVIIRIKLSFVISVCNLTDSTIHCPKAWEHLALIK